MGGRGSKSASSNVRVLSEEEFPGLRGLSSPISDYMIDKVRHQ